MNALQTLFVIVGGIGMATALTLPDRQTAKIIEAGGKATQGLFGTVITGKA